MSDEFNLSMRKFLKTVGVTSQREIEEAIRKAQEAGKLNSVSVKAKMTLEIEDVGLSHIIEGEIDV